MLTAPDRGLSPRGRGNPGPAQHHAAQDGSIPAWAGQPLLEPLNADPDWVYPRVGGATASMMWPVNQMRGLSPRGRGNRRGNARQAFQDGSIPAWAGQPFVEWLPFVYAMVYPRVGGATAL